MSSPSRRAPNQTTTSISISRDLLDYARQQAAAEDRSVSYYLGRLIERELRSQLDSSGTVAETPKPYGTPKRRRR